MSSLKSIFEDNSGGYSFIRFICFIWFVALLWQWFRANGNVQGIPDIPNGVAGITMTLLGAKALQRFGEKSETPEKPAEPNRTT
jgi:hypothetical protein